MKKFLNINTVMGKIIFFDIDNILSLKIYPDYPGEHFQCKVNNKIDDENYLVVISEDEKNKIIKALTYEY